jgi:hypothetical protein
MPPGHKDTKVHKEITLRIEYFHIFQHYKFMKDEINNYLIINSNHVNSQFIY